MSNHDIDRRAFIALGTAAVAGLAVPRLYGDDASARVVSVGYRPFQTRTRAVNVARGPALVDAASVAYSEPSLMRTGARFTIRGNAQRSVLAVDVHHPADFVDGKVVFYAWNSDASGLTFNVPVELQRTVDIAITADKTKQLFPFTIGDAPGALKLNTGKYVFAVGPRAASWRSHFVENDLLKNVDGSDVDFDYVILSVASRS